MSSAESARERCLSRKAKLLAASRGLSEEDVTTEMEIVDQSLWMQSIEQRNNTPEAWLEFVEYISARLGFENHTTRTTFLTNLYARILKTIRPDTAKNNAAYVELLLANANLKALTNVDDARNSFSHARCFARNFAIVYITAAQFELSQGNTKRAKRHLVRGWEVCANPVQWLSIAWANLNRGHATLLSDSEKLQPSESPPSGSEGHSESVAAKNVLSDRRTNTHVLREHRLLGKAMRVPKSCTATDDPSSSEGTDSQRQQTQRQSTSDEDTDGSGIHRLLQPTVVERPSASVIERAEHSYTGTMTRVDHHNLQSAGSTWQSHTQPVMITKMTVDDDRANNQPANAGKYHTAKLPCGKENWPAATPSYTALKMGSTSVSDFCNRKEPTVTSTGVGDSVRPVSRRLNTSCSTPDCKNPSLLRQLEESKKKNIWRPLRVPRSQVTQLSEELCESAHTEPLISRTQTDGEYPCVEGVRALDEHTTGADCASSAAGEDVRKMEQHKVCELPLPPLAQPQHRDQQSEIHQQQPGSQCRQQQREPSVYVERAPQILEPSPPASLQHQSKRVCEEPVSQATTISPPQPARLGHRDDALSKTDLPDGGQTAVANAATPETPPQQQQLKTFVINNKVYTVLKKIGVGGSSKVYDALNSQMNLRAVKVVNLRSADAAMAAGYKNEIQLLKRMQHSKHVIRLYDFEYKRSEQLLYIVLERGDTDLDSFFKSNTSSTGQQSGVPADLCQYYWRKMLEAVNDLHKADVIHLDLKPANFLLVAGSLKLIDFGIASAVASDATSVTRDQQQGTITFMSPEAIVDRSEGGGAGDSDKPRIKVRPKSDVWSLGCILYKLVYGYTPLQHVPTLVGRMMAIMNPATKFRFAPIDDQNLLHVMQSCLKYDPKDRASIEELLRHPYLTRCSVAQR